MTLAGLGHIAAYVEQTIGHLEVRHALAEQLTETGHCGLDPPWVAAALEAGRRLRAQAEPLGGTGDRHRGEIGGLEKDFDLEVVSSPSGVTHLTFTRTEI